MFKVSYTANEYSHKTSEEGKRTNQFDEDEFVFNV